MNSDASKFDKMVNMDWPKLWEAIGTRTGHMVECDDAEGFLTVMADQMGDIHLVMDVGRRMTGVIPTFRSRTFGGWGRNERVRIALALLALAIVEDVETKS